MKHAKVISHVMLPMRKKRRSAEFKNNSQVIDMNEARRLRQQKRQAEKEREEERNRYAASQKTRGKMAIRRSRNRRRLLVVIIVMSLIGVITFSLLNVISLKKEQHEVMQQAEELQQEKEQLEKDLAEINEPENIEQQARDQLRLIKPGEKLYMFPEEINESQEAQDSKEGKEDKKQEQE